MLVVPFLTHANASNIIIRGSCECLLGLLWGPCPGAGFRTREMSVGGNMIIMNVRSHPKITMYLNGNDPPMIMMIL